MNEYFKDEFAFLSEFKDRIEKRYITTLNDSSLREKYNVLGEMISELISENWLQTNQLLKEKSFKEVYYFSMEFLMGRLITNNIQNLGVRPLVDKALKLVNLDLNEIEFGQSFL